jgi:hypothetical protein
MQTVSNPKLVVSIAEGDSPVTFRLNSATPLSTIGAFGEAVNVCAWLIKLRHSKENSSSFFIGIERSVKLRKH